MSDSIDLDEMEVGESEDDEENDANYGDWLWRGEGDPEDEPDSHWGASSTDSADKDAAATDQSEPGVPDDESAATVEADSPDSEESKPTDSVDDGADTPPDESSEQQPTPGVPHTSEGPVGVPESRGGSGGGSSSQDTGSEPATTSTERTTNHGGEPEADDMTLAMTYEAMNRLENPQFVMTDARGWADWVGIVGKVSTPAIRKFQRDHTLELDFFGGSDTGPDQRLVDITPESMFYADRMVLVGTANDEWIAEAADWEFIPLETAAEKADWTIEHAE